MIAKQPPFQAWICLEKEIAIASNSDQAIVPWWSYAKTVLAAAALVLVQDGLLNLDIAVPQQRFTLRHLLQHRSGLPDYGELDAYQKAVADRREAWPAKTILELTDAARLRFEPGNGWAYSNIGYWFIRRLIEETTGENLDGALRRLVFDPLEIASAKVASTRKDLSDLAVGLEFYDPGWVYHGLITGTLKDAALLLIGLFSGKLLEPPLLVAMTDVFWIGGPIEGRPWQKPGYGLGLMIGEMISGHCTLGHVGGGPGSSIAVFHFPSLHRTAAAFIAAENASAVETCVENLILKGQTSDRAGLLSPS